MAGMLVATIQRGGRVDPLLAGVLATFILTSVNLLIMGRPNINLLSQTTLFSHAFGKNEWLGWSLVSCFVIFICSFTFVFLQSRLGLTLRALGDNPILLKRLGKNMEGYRMLGFALTNTLSAFAGCLTAETIGFADINMGLGMTLTGIGAIILGHQLVFRFFKLSYFRVGAEFVSCFIGVVLYFFSLNLLLRLDIDPIYLKMILGFILIIFLRTATFKKTTVSV
jgi:putative ABC transport system permease protein